MMPLMGFVMGCVAFTILGLTILRCIPGLRLTLFNLFLFVVGSFPGALAFLFVYGQIFAKKQLSNGAFVGIFPVLLVGGSLGGMLVVWLKTRFMNAQLARPPL